MKLRIWCCVASALLLLTLSVPSRAQTITVVLLGTGSPEPAVDRFGPATLVDAGGQRFLIDVGRGVTQRLWQLPLRVGQISNVLVTHLHSDHTVGLPDLWLSGWLQTRFGRRTSPLRVLGPTGTAALVQGVREAYAGDIRARPESTALDSAVAIEGRDIDQGVIHDQGGVRVTAFEVEHGNPPIPAVGYRIDFGGHAVVISGDTKPSANLIGFARGADLVVHEVMAAFPEAQSAPATSRIIASHTSPEQAGHVFAALNPRLAVLTHVSLVAVPERRQALLDSILPWTRRAYAGRVIIGEDLMTIIVGDTIEVRRRSDIQRN
jgi:ribonuclease Z